MILAGRIAMSWIVGIIFLAAAVALSQLSHSKSFIGFVGEQGVRSQLSKLDKSKYLIINDLMIPNGRGNGTSQIDHVVVGPGGIAVIETKNWAGRIFGKGYERQWTVVLGRRKYRKENPILQNKGHIAALQRILGSDVPMHNIVSFGDRAADLRISDVRDADLVHPRNLVQFIRGIGVWRLSAEQCHAIHQQLLAANITNSDARKRHVKSIQQKFK